MRHEFFLNEVYRAVPLYQHGKLFYDYIQGICYTFVTVLQTIVMKCLYFSFTFLRLKNIIIHVKIFPLQDQSSKGTTVEHVHFLQYYA